MDPFDTRFERRYLVACVAGVLFFLTAYILGALTVRNGYLLGVGCIGWIALLACEIRCVIDDIRRWRR